MGARCRVSGLVLGAPPCSCTHSPVPAPAGGKYKGIVDVLMRIVNEEGYQKLWAGVSSSLLLVRALFGEAARLREEREEQTGLGGSVRACKRLARERGNGKEGVGEKGREWEGTRGSELPPHV